jgi:D-amino-acid dehydrogenase
MGIRTRTLTPDEATALEPALAALRPRLAGVLHGMDDESGDAHLFCRELAARAQAAGVRFIYDARLYDFDMVRGRIRGIRLLDSDFRAGVLQADAVVIAAGSYSPALVARFGERLPIYPVKGYSITAPIIDPERAPRHSLTDESRRIVCSRLGNVLRVAGTAELNGFDLSPNPARSASIVNWLEEHLPGAADIEQAQHWCGLRPATPSNVPLIGRTRIDNLYLNTGHGTLGGRWPAARGGRSPTSSPGANPNRTSPSAPERRGAEISRRPTPRTGFDTRRLTRRPARRGADPRTARRAESGVPHPRSPPRHERNATRQESSGVAPLH